MVYFEDIHKIWPTLIQDDDFVLILSKFYYKRIKRKGDKDI